MLVPLTVSIYLFVAPTSAPQSVNYGPLIEAVERACAPDGVEFINCSGQVSALEAAAAADRASAILAKALGSALWRLSIVGGIEAGTLRARAVAEFERAVSLAPNDTEAKFELAQLVSDINQIESLITQIVTDEPQHREALERLRVALEKWIDETDDQGRFFEPPEALKAYEQLAEKRAWTLFQRRFSESNFNQ